MRRLLLSLLLVLVALPATAQAVVNPRWIAFTASPDHDREVAGIAVLTSYRVDFYLPGAPLPFQPGADLGKPVPDPTTREIAIENPSLFALPIGEYLGKVAAIGPGGEGVSEPSNPFVSLGPPAAGGRPSFRR